ncbi:MAG: DUF805 domain-containing protein [Clostridia bacterium]|nr:DUF805 domain-containing protein [Clostridia bacterium]
MIQAYINYWKGYVDFNGKTSVGGYWWAFLANVIVSIVIGVIALALPIISTIFSAVNLIPGIAIAIRRLRDAGYKWYNIFWLLLPLAGVIIFIVLLVKPSK